MPSALLTTIPGDVHVTGTQGATVAGAAVEPLGAAVEPPGAAVEPPGAAVEPPGAGATVVAGGGRVVGLPNWSVSV